MHEAASPAFHAVLRAAIDAQHGSPHTHGAGLRQSRPSAISHTRRRRPRCRRQPDRADCDWRPLNLGERVQVQYLNQRYLAAYEQYHRHRHRFVQVPLPGTADLRSLYRDRSRFCRQSRSAMLEVGSFRTRTCGTIGRRSFLQLAGSIPLALELGGRVAAPAEGRRAPRAKSVIFVFVWGAPSHLERLICGRMMYNLRWIGRRRTAQSGTRFPRPFSQRPGWCRRPTRASRPGLRRAPARNWRWHR